MDDDLIFSAERQEPLTPRRKKNDTTYFVYYSILYCATMNSPITSASSRASSPDTDYCHSNNHSPVADKRLLSVGLEEWPRRGSLPISSQLIKTKHFGNIKVSLSRPESSTEIYVPNRNSRLQETPLSVR